MSLKGGSINNAFTTIEDAIFSLVLESEFVLVHTAMFQKSCIIFSSLAIGIIKGGFIPGKSCGSLTKITTIEKMPTNQAEIDALECVIVKDEQSYQDYYSANFTCQYLFLHTL